MFKPFFTIAALAVLSAFAPASSAQDLRAALDAPKSVRSADLTASELYAQGLARSIAGDQKAALETFQKLAARGNATAQRRLGEIYDAGNGATRRDYILAIYWYQRAREQGEPLMHPLRRNYGAMGPGG
ncbi:MAG: hypothetical protein ABUS57_20775 [Pseudomonadota bacterium]